MIGLLITNTGTPDAPTTKAVRRYLREFLSDPRIVHLPRLIWLPILYGLILPFRSPKSAKLYQEIWTAEGSPMRLHMEQLREKLEVELNKAPPEGYCVAVGMNYGNPSIAAGLKKLRDQGAERIIVMPLFPQYSDTSSGSSFDKVSGVIKIHDYHDHPAYIAALAQSVEDHWQQHGKGEHLLISFHGIPQRFAASGDPYPNQCARTAQLLAEALQLANDKWTLCYQSQFGYDKWLKPSTQDLLVELPKQGIKSLDIVCPGFSVDCLETLEEIEMRGAHTFMAEGGKKLNYIKALNSNPSHIEALANIIAAQ